MSRSFVVFIENNPDGLTYMKYIQWNGNEHILTCFKKYLDNQNYDKNQYILNISEQFSEEVVNQMCNVKIKNHTYSKYYSNCTGSCKFKEYFKTSYNEGNNSVFLTSWNSEGTPFMEKSLFIPIFNLFYYYTHRCS